MSQAELSPSRATPEPMPANLRSVQPGGGVCYRIELAWGRVRRAWLQRVRPGYVARMAARRRGSDAGAPHPVLDPRDLKYCRNVCTARWDPADDPYRWRGRLGLARWGLAEVQLLGYPLAALAFGLALSPWPYLALVPAVLAALVVYFFRDPRRRVPTEPGLLVAPCDGCVSEVTPVAHDDFVGGPAVRIGVFLSIFNVHINRAPERARVLALRYSPGEFLNALNPLSALRNENLWIGLEEEQPPHRRHAVRQIAGLYARRIVCQLRTGDLVERGEQFGMIKLGSRTELIVPDHPDVEVLARVGQRVRAGTTVLVRCRPTAGE
jgi:phosphatidylserine decarboxylase